jgi:hypothetical protein
MKTATPLAPAKMPKATKANNKAYLAESAETGADIAEFGMQVAREGHSSLLCTPIPDDSEHTAKTSN